MWKLCFVLVCLVGFSKARDECESYDWATATQIVASTRCVDLEVQNAKISSDQDFFAFLEVLKQNRILKKIEVDNCGLSHLQVAQLLGALQLRQAELFKIELVGNTFTPETANAIEAYFSAATTLRSINLANNGIDDRTLKIILSSLPPQVHELDLSDNPITNLGLKSIIQDTRKSFLKEVELERTSIDDQGVQDVLNELVDGTPIRELDLKGSKVSYDMSRTLKQALRQVGSRGGGARGFAAPVRVTAMSSWDERKVKEWLMGLHPSFKKYGNAMIDNAVNGEVLSKLTDDDLADLGIDNAFHRKRILSEVHKLNHPDELR